MGEIITESGVDFGEFESEDLFPIESSNLLKSLGKGIKTVEFITLKQKDNIIFVEAKTGCPNPQNKEKGGQDAKNFNAFYDDIADTEEFKLLKEMAIDGRSYLEMADSRNISIDACRKRVQRAKETLRKKIRF